MAEKGVTPAKIIAALMIIFGIIHFAVGVGIVSKYKKYGDVWRQPVGLSAFNIIIGILGIATGIVSLIATFQKREALSKVVSIMGGVLGILTIASFIAALALNSQAVTFVRNRMSFHMNTYIELDGSIDLMDRIQSNYQCCGENLWLDWARAGLGTTGTITNPGTGIGTGTNTGTGTGTGTNIGTGTGTGTNIGTGTGTGTNIGTGTNPGTVTTGRRRRSEYVEPSYSPLVAAIRRKRQISGGNIYNFPTTYTINLPLSCCINGGTSSSGNSVGGYCVYNAGNGTNGFYVEGCVVPVANIVINVFLATLSVLILIMNYIMFPNAFKNKDPNKPSLSNQVQQEHQQVNNGVYYGNNVYYGNDFYPIQASAYTQVQPQYQTAYIPQYQSPAPPAYVTYQ